MSSRFSTKTPNHSFQRTGVPGPPLSSTLGVTRSPGRVVAGKSPLALNTALPYYLGVRTVAETPIFQRYSAEVWAEVEREEFVSFIAANPEAGSVIRGSGGCRKVRWSTAGQGKSGGARVIYFNAEDATIWLLIVYKKAKFDNLPTSFLVELKKGVEDAL